MASFAYKLKTPQDLLRKLYRIHCRYDAERDLWASDHAFDFVVTAWHLTDWVWEHRNRENPGS